jgi:hypothetical protein
MKLGKITLTDSQAATVKELSSGNILVAGVGSGKTYTSIAWASQYLPERELIVITTAMNRNNGAWHDSIEACGITDYTVDSWNNIHKYQHKENCVFIFDEQRVVGYGFHGLFLYYFREEYRRSERVIATRCVSVCRYVHDG